MTKRIDPLDGLADSLTSIHTELRKRGNGLSALGKQEVRDRKRAAEASYLASVSPEAHAVWLSGVHKADDAEIPATEAYGTARQEPSDPEAYAAPDDNDELAEKSRWILENPIPGVSSSQRIMELVRPTTTI